LIQTNKLLNTLQFQLEKDQNAQKIIQGGSS
jgi:hypothetical protein